MVVSTCVCTTTTLFYTVANFLVRLFVYKDERTVDLCKVSDDIIYKSCMSLDFLGGKDMKAR